MNPKKIIQKYRAVAYAQLLPVLLCLGFIIWLSAVLVLFTFIPPLIGRNVNSSGLSTYQSVVLGIILPLCSIIIFGLISFLISSYQFIRSTKHEDYERIIKGMVHLNRAWIILLIFSLFMTSFLSYVFYSYFSYGYF